MLDPSDSFERRHIGPRDDELADMLALLGIGSLDELADGVVPAPIQLRRPLDLGDGCSESEALRELRAIAQKNRPFRSMIGMGYYGTITPPVILRHILENPLWYTPYTPYQAEIAQGRLEALLNFQTMISELTGLPLAGASLLDEATAAAEAMAMCCAIARDGSKRASGNRSGGKFGGRAGDSPGGGTKPAFFVASDCHPQTIAVVRTRARSMGIDLQVGQPDSIDFGRRASGLCGVLVQYPTTDGRVEDYGPLTEQAHDSGVLVVVAADLLSLVLLRPPGDPDRGGLGADIAVGSGQRFGVSMGYGGPHAAYLATTEQHVRRMPGRLVGVSKDTHGAPAYRLAVQTREQHIRRDRATSNICTAQVLLAIMAGMYAVYHGPEGLKRIARRVHALTTILAEGLRRMGSEVRTETFFDTIAVSPVSSGADVVSAAAAAGINLRRIDEGTVGISCDETTTPRDLQMLFDVFAGPTGAPFTVEQLIGEVVPVVPDPLARKDEFLQQPLFNRYHSEHELLRYVTRLQNKDISLASSMIPLGSCTMKLNAVVEMVPATWPHFMDLHPYAPADQAAGYAELFDQLEDWLAELSGFAAVSLQPNAGSQGEYAGLLAIRAYHASRGEGQRDVCLIPVSAHGTNPASAVIAGLRVVTVACNGRGDIDVEDLRARAQEHRHRLAALMITYPSTHGVFEESVCEVCRIVHEQGGQVYLDGANMNAMVGLCRPGGDRGFGADLCHLNLHKTFCIPHGGGGPGMGPIAVAEHLGPFLPGHPPSGDGAVSAAPYGSPSILPISWMYIRMMGGAGLTRATQIAILNANYMARRLETHYDVLYTGRDGLVAHEFIVDCRRFETSASIRVEDIAKRLMDFGFHAPTMSWPVAGTIMIEPTESESKEELDRFCDALIAIRQEIAAIERGERDKQDNPLKHAPHTAAAVSSDDWSHPYSRQEAAYPLPWVRDRKFWPPVGRIDSAYGDRHLVCTCPPTEDWKG